MADDPMRAERAAAMFEKPYFSQSPSLPAEQRTITALEYSAAQLFKIRKVLEEMNERDKSRG